MLSQPITQHREPTRDRGSELTESAQPRTIGTRHTRNLSIFDDRPTPLYGKLHEVTNTLSIQGIFSHISPTLRVRQAVIHNCPYAYRSSSSAEIECTCRPHFGVAWLFSRHVNISATRGSSPGYF